MCLGTDRSRELLLSIDVGTTACKAAVFTPDGAILALAYREYPLIHPGARLVEQDAEQWWQLIMELILECTKAIGNAQRAQIKAIGISAQGITFVPVDQAGNPTANAITWLDSRAVDEADDLQKQFGAKGIFKTTGVQPNPVYMLPKMIWLRKNRPEVYAKTHRFCTCQDFIIHRFTGYYVTDFSIAGGSMMYDMKSLDWSEELLAAAFLPKTKLPRLAGAGAVVGTLQKPVAETLLLPDDTLVVLGGHDQECAGLGAGLQGDNMTVSLGTAAIVLASTGAPVLDEKMRISCLPSVEKDQWILEAAVSVGGAGLRWIRDMLRDFAGALPQPAQSLDYDGLTALAAGVCAGESDVLFFPHLTGATAPYWVPASGMFYGISLATRVEHLVQAILEGWAFQVRHNVEIMKELAYDPAEIVIFGGGAKNAFLLQLMANIIGKPVQVPSTPEAALLGAAILAGVGSGVYNDVRAAQKQAVHIRQRLEPQAEDVRHYQAVYRKYLHVEQYLLRAGVAPACGKDK